MNRGTPCARIENSEMLISVLRSPTFPNCLLWPEFYNAPVYDRMRDFGSHSFEYSLTSFMGDWRSSGIVRQAEIFNRKPLCFSEKCKMPLEQIVLDSSSTRISSMKKAEEDHSIIVRLVEEIGQHDNVVIKLPKNCKGVQETNLLEKNVQEYTLHEDGCVSLEMRAFEIKTLRVVL